MLSDRPYFVLCDAPGVFGRNEGAACTGAIVFRHACLYNDLNVPFCMLFSDSSELFLFILCKFFFVLIRAERASAARVHVMAEKRSVTNLDV